MWVPLPITLTPALGTCGHPFPNGLQTAVACCWEQGERRGRSHGEVWRGSLFLFPALDRQGRAGCLPREAQGVFSKFPGRRVSGISGSPSCFSFSYVRGAQQGKATSQGQSSQRSLIPPTICTSQFTSQMDPWAELAHPGSLHTTGSCPSGPMLPCIQQLGHPAPTHGLSQLLLRLRWSKGTKTHTHTHRAPKPQERNLWWEPDLGVVCLEAVPFNTEFPSITRAALGHIVRISRIIEV